MGVGVNSDYFESTSARTDLDNDYVAETPYVQSLLLELRFRSVQMGRWAHQLGYPVYGHGRVDLWLNHIPQTPPIYDIMLKTH